MDTVYTDRDGDSVYLQADPDDLLPTFGVDTGEGTYGVYLDLEAAEAIAAALTKWADAEKARQKAVEEARQAAEARKLKRGEKVFGVYSGAEFTVVTDQDDLSLVDVVSIRTGNLLGRIHRESLTRTKGETA